LVFLHKEIVELLTPHWAAHPGAQQRSDGTYETHGIHFWLGNSRLPGVVFEQERDALVVHNVAMLDAMSAQPDCILYRIWVGGMGRTLGSTQSIRFA
jgi:hypothetical protein